jgi:hypothetical protein
VTSSVGNELVYREAMHVYIYMLYSIAYMLREVLARGWACMCQLLTSRSFLNYFCHAVSLNIRQYHAS